MNYKKRILFATKNSGKLLEFKKAFEKLDSTYEIVSINDLPYTIPDCEETGKTFAENALLKTKNTRMHLRSSEKDIIVIADDSGMEIDCLNGEPGIHTRRWAGYEMTDDEIVDYCLEKLADKQNRTALYVSCFVISLPNNTEKVITDRSAGIILHEPRHGSQLSGMPFRALFFVPELNLMFHEVRELSLMDRKGYKLGHEQAVQKIIDYINSVSL